MLHIIGTRDKAFGENDTNLSCHLQTVLKESAHCGLSTRYLYQPEEIIRRKQYVTEEKELGGGTKLKLLMECVAQEWGTNQI
jgi:hypothetical protein